MAAAIINSFLTALKAIGNTKNDSAIADGVQSPVPFVTNKFRQIYFYVIFRFSLEGLEIVRKTENTTNSP